MTFSDRSHADLLILELMPSLQVVVQTDRCAGEPAAAIDRAVRAAMLGERPGTGGPRGVYVLHHGKLAGRPSLAAVDPPGRVPGRLRPATKRTPTPRGGVVAMTQSFPPSLGDQG